MMIGAMVSCGSVLGGIARSSEGGHLGGFSYVFHTYPPAGGVGFYPPGGLPFHFAPINYPYSPIIIEFNNLVL